MELHIIIISIMYSTLIINICIKKYFDKLTSYNGIKMHNMSLNFIILFIFFGYIMIFFYKRIREYRKIEYMKNYIKQWDWFKVIKNTLDYDITDEKYITYKRYLKIKKLKY